MYAVDDFDRPLTESNIRLFAGAMLDMLKDEFDGHDLHDTLFRMREELRYYADVMRFASICYQLSEPLGLGVQEERKRPTAERVIALLCALAERTLSSPLIRADLDTPPPRQDDAVKAEKQRWDKEKKALSSASLQAKGTEAKRLAEEVSSSRARANKIRVKHQEHEHALATIETNLHAAAARHSLRYGPLLVDHEKRIYYVLSIRPVDRPPIGWASGLLVWGKGDKGDDWHHFGKSTDVAQLVKWLRYKGNQVDALEPVVKWLEALEKNGMGELED